MHGGNTTVKTRMLQEEEGKKDTMKRRKEKDDRFFFFFRAVNNTFLQIPQLRKHKCEKETTARATERERKEKQGWAQVRLCTLPGTLLNDTVTGYSILISYIDTYPLCDNKPCPVILHVVSSTHSSVLHMVPRTDPRRAARKRTPLIFCERGGHRSH